MIDLLRRQAVWKKVTTAQYEFLLAMEQMLLHEVLMLIPENVWVKQTKFSFSSRKVA